MSHVFLSSHPILYKIEQEKLEKRTSQTGCGRTTQRSLKDYKEHKWFEKEVYIFSTKRLVAESRSFFFLLCLTFSHRHGTFTGEKTFPYSLGFPNGIYSHMGPNFRLFISDF